MYAQTTGRRSKEAESSWFGSRMTTGQRLMLIASCVGVVMPAWCWSASQRTWVGPCVGIGVTNHESPTLNERTSSRVVGGVGIVCARDFDERVQAGLRVEQIVVEASPDEGGEPTKVSYGRPMLTALMAEVDGRCLRIGTSSSGIWASGAAGAGWLREGGVTRQRFAGETTKTKGNVVSSAAGRLSVGVMRMGAERRIAFKYTLWALGLFGSGKFEHVIGAGVEMHIYP